MPAAIADELMSVTQAKNELPNRLRRLKSGELDRVVLLSRSSPVAVIVTVDEYQRLQEVEKMREEIEDVISALRAKAAGQSNGISLDELEERLRGA